MIGIGRSFYEELLEWGVRVYEFTAGLNHKKAMLLDDEWLMIGSANSDHRSMRLNFELNLLVHAPKQAAEFEAVLLREFEQSVEITFESFPLRSLPHRLWNAALRPLAPML
jgi:cardiolipin synthase